MIEIGIEIGIEIIMIGNIVLPPFLPRSILDQLAQQPTWSLCTRIVVLE